MTANPIENNFEICSVQEVASNLLTNNRSKRQSTSVDQPSSKRQKSIQGNRTLPEPGAEFISGTGKISIEAVQESYRSAIQDGRLNYKREPQLGLKWNESLKVKPWDPYILAPKVVPRALLDKEKVESITQSVKSTIWIVPEAVEWIPKTQLCSLTPENVQRILQKAFVLDGSSLKQQPGQDDKLSPILKIAAKALRRARELHTPEGTFRREVAILQLVAYASIEVSVATGEATARQVESSMESLAGGGKDWLWRACSSARFWFWAMVNLTGWEGRHLPLFFMLVDEHGETTLRNFFQSVFPAVAGEFVSTLSSEVYWKNLPDLTRLPSLIEIEIGLLGGYVKREIIGSVFGCPVSYLDGLDPNLFSDMCTQAIASYKPKLLWRDAADETGREDQTKKDDGRNIDDNNDPCLSVGYIGNDFEDLFWQGFISSPYQQ